MYELYYCWSLNIVLHEMHGHDEWGPCHHNMACPQVSGGGTASNR